jgi:hypothetical protein
MDTLEPALDLPELDLPASPAADVPPVPPGSDEEPVEEPLDEPEWYPSPLEACG